MTVDPRAGSPRASSRETLAEAACELFLEQGYEATSIADITTRAGVSRSSFFNYFASKADILWAASRRAGRMPRSRQLDEPRMRRPDVRDILIADRRTTSRPTASRWRVANAAAMGLDDELERERALRQARLARAVADRAAPRRRRAPARRGAGAAGAGAVLAAVVAVGA